jgi:dTDP-4-dehydrorhamnose 3,5-epimerase
MEATPLHLPGLVLISLKVYRDGRGFFVERYNQARFQALGLPTQFIQDNHSRSAPGVLRGLHFQEQPPQGKLIGVIRGCIWDVAVDLRSESPTLGQSFGSELNDVDGKLLWVPAGFGHGFCVLGDQPADVIYKVDVPYQPAGEGGIHWADPDLAIAWPIASPIVSERDQKLGSFAEYCRRKE